MAIGVFKGKQKVLSHFYTQLKYNKYIMIWRMFPSRLKIKLGECSFDALKANNLIHGKNLRRKFTTLFESIRIKYDKVLNEKVRVKLLIMICCSKDLLSKKKKYKSVL